jgi:L-asparaginase
MKADHTGLVSPVLDGEQLMAAIPSIRNRAVVEIFEFKNVPSSYLTMEDLVQLRDFAEQLEEKGCSGAVITHGTDTMEETAYFLDITYRGGIPVVLTGAQRNPSLISPDGPVNMADAILTAADGKAHSMGVVIVFASEIIPAREASKLHRSRVDTFKSLEFGPIGTINNDRVTWHRRPPVTNKYPVTVADKRVDIICSYIGADSDMIFSSIERGAAGIVIEALGGGHVPPKMLDGIKKAIAEGLPVVLTSRVPMGRLLTDTYGYEGGEKHLRNLGVILGEDLPAWKARIKLVVLLSAGMSLDQIKHEFENRFYGI